MNDLSKLTSLACCVALVVAGCAPAHQQPASTASKPDRSGEVRAAAAEFVAAFNDLDQPRFDALWAEDATVFFPQPPFPIRRVEGKAQVVGWFKRFMDGQRSAGKSPGVDPRDLQIQMAGAESAIVSFHLGSAATAAARRTLVYRRDSTGWRIIHLHGSALRSEAASGNNPAP